MNILTINGENIVGDNIAYFSKFTTTDGKNSYSVVLINGKSFDITEEQYNKLLNL